LTGIPHRSVWPGSGAGPTFGMCGATRRPAPRHAILVAHQVVGLVAHGRGIAHRLARPVRREHAHAAPGVEHVRHVAPVTVAHPAAVAGDERAGGGPAGVGLGAAARVERLAGHAQAVLRSRVKLARTPVAPAIPAHPPCRSGTTPLTALTLPAAPPLGPPPLRSPPLPRQPCARTRRASRRRTRAPPLPP